MNVKDGTIVILGMPFDANSSFLTGAAQAPQCIREALRSPASNMCSESGRDLSVEPRLIDGGDLFITDYLPHIHDPVAQLLQSNVGIISLGGDHSITYPIVKAYAAKYPHLILLQLDAHPDLYDQYDGNPHAHGCPFARIMESGLVKRLIQIGIRTMNPHQQAQADRFNVEVIPMNQLRDIPPLDGPVYLSLDLDVLDPAFAPGVAHHEPGGLSSRQLIHYIQSLNAPLVGADIVELNPRRDPLGITAAVAAKCLKEIADKMLKK